MTQTKPCGPKDADAGTSRNPLKPGPTAAGHQRDLPALVVVIAVLAVSLRLGLAVATQYTQEDFLITLRYAENIAQGHGFVYNSGERILGTTTPLYALLLAGADWLGLPAPIVGKALNILADGGLCLVVYRVLAWVKQENAGVCVAFLVAVNPIQMRVAISGQESSLAALCGASVWLLFLQRRYIVAYVAGAVLFLLRWDGLLLVAVLTLAILVRERRLPVRALLAFGLACAPWLVFASWYFGSPIPVTLAAKTVVYGWYFGSERFPELPRLLFRLGGTPLYAALTIAAVGAWRLCREHRWAFAPPVAWFALYWIAFLSSRVWLFEWYLVPPLFVYEMLAGLGLATLAERLGILRQCPLRCAAPLALAGLVGFLNVRDTLSYTRGLQGLEDHLRRPLGRWLRAHSRPTDRIMLEPIGYIGYYSRLPVVDMIGLVTPSMLPCYDRKNACPWLLIADAYRPEWCILRPSEVAPMQRASQAAGRPWEKYYRHIKSFSYAAPSDKSPTVFEVCQRRSQPTVPARPRLFLEQAPHRPAKAFATTGAREAVGSGGSGSNASGSQNSVRQFEAQFPA